MNKDTILRILIVVGVLYTALLVVMIIFFAMSINILSGLRVSYDNQSGTANQSQNQSNTTPVSFTTPTNTTDDTSAVVDNTPAVDDHMETYTDPTYNFEVQYPDNYNVVTDASGWPEASLILYKGGQSYDFVVEVWDSEAAYQAKYYTQMDLDRLTVKTNAGKFFTLLNSNNTDEVAQIISTFKFN